MIKNNQRLCQVAPQLREEEDRELCDLAHDHVCDHHHGNDPPRVPEIKPLGQILRPRNNLLTPSPIRLCPAELGGRGGLSGRHQGELQVRQLFTDYLVAAALDFCHSRLHIRS